MFFDFESENGDFLCILGACPRDEGGMAPPGPLGSASGQMLSLEEWVKA